MGRAHEGCAEGVRHRCSQQVLAQHANNRCSLKTAVLLSLSKI